MLFLGTLINVITVGIGGSIGLLVYKNIPKRVIEISFQGVGILTFFIGIKMALVGNDIIIMALSIIFGTILGEYIDIETRINNNIEKAKLKFKIKNEKLSSGITTSFMLFCIGSMTILGTMEEGLGQGSKILITKAILDGFASIGLSSSLGIGVIFSVLPLFIFQGSLTLFFKLFGNMITNDLLNILTGVGGLLIIGLGITLIGIKNIRVLNMTPSLLFSILIYIVKKIAIKLF
ncbi:MAG TPA: DUF554 domain-containing protein [Spirochaetota bacterium]|nr:DUF554 domain-containing protein [Spirochaetota bacterium]HPQ49761.1 DUF554 domain-containing protein [Spirochaetota bacterium]